MKNNNMAETAKNGQTATQNIQPEKVVKSLDRIKGLKDAKKDKTPTGKVVSLKETEERRKAREKAYHDFRIGSLRRRCKRMKISEEETEKLVKELEAQLNEPNNYSVLLIIDTPDIAFTKEALKNNKIDARIIGDYYAWIDCDQNTLNKLREILPQKVKIHPYVKKKPPVLPKERVVSKHKKPTNNTSSKKAATKAARKAIKMMKFAGRKKGIGKKLAKLKKHTTLLEIKAKKGSKSKNSGNITPVHKNPSKSIKTMPKASKKAA